MKFTDEEKERIKGLIKIKKCANCGSDEGLVFLNNKSSFITTKQTPKIEIDKSIPVAAYVCQKCGYIMSFSIDVLNVLF